MVYYRQNSIDFQRCVLSSSHSNRKCLRQWVRSMSSNMFLIWHASRLSSSFLAFILRLGLLESRNKEQCSERKWGLAGAAHLQGMQLTDVFILSPLSRTLRLRWSRSISSTCWTGLIRCGESQRRSHKTLTNTREAAASYHVILPSSSAQIKVLIPDGCNRTMLFQI
jgi:hypothetical protein